MFTRRALLTTSAAAMAAACLPAVASEQITAKNLWQKKVDSVFSTFDDWQFTIKERCQALYVRPLNTDLSVTPDNLDIRRVIDFQIERSVYKQERVDHILTIARNLEIRFDQDQEAYRNYLDTAFAGYGELTLRQLITSGDRHGLYQASRHTNVLI